MSGVGSASGYAEVQAVTGSVVLSGPTTALAWASVRITDGANFIGDAAHPVNVTGSVTLSSSATVNQGTGGASAWKVDGSAVTQPVSAVSLPLPASAAQEHIGVGSFHSIRVTDGVAFYDLVKTGQLPAALVGGRLDTNNGAWLGSTAPTVGSKTSTNSIPVVIASDQGAVAVSGTVTDNQGTANTLANGWPVKVTDGVNTLPTMDAVARAAFMKVTDGTNTSTVKAASTASVGTDTSLVVALAQQQPATYAAVSGVFTPAASATDVFVITGSASKTVKILRIIITASQTTAGQFVVTGIKRSADDTAGTSATITSVPLDSNNAAVTAVLRSYTVNPTALGAAVGTVRSEKMFIGATTTTVEDEVIWDFTPPYRQPIVLRGAAQIFAINLGGVTLTGGSLDIEVEFTEE